MQGIKNIIFDLGGVILNIDTRLTEQAFVAMGAKDFSSYFGHGFADSFFKDYETGHISDRQFIDSLKTLISAGARGDSGSTNEKELTDERVMKAWNALLLDFPAERIELLRSLARRYRVFLFSNTNAIHLEAFRKIYKDTFGGGSLDDHFEKAYYSHLMGLRKPDPTPFKQIIKDNGLVASETLFVDDALINVEGAIAAGLQGLYLKPGMTILDIPFI